MTVTIDELLQELEQEAPATRRVLERVPENRLDWKPHEKSPTFGKLAMHVAALPGAIAEIAVRIRRRKRRSTPSIAPSRAASSPH